MSAPPDFEVDIEKAEKIWAEYERTHDLAANQDLAVGIDPETGEIHFGKTAKAITLRLMEEGRNKPLFFRWVKSPYYTRKVRKRVRVSRL